MYHVLGKVYAETEFRCEDEANQINVSDHSGYQRIAHAMAKRQGFQLGFGRNLDAWTAEEFEALLVRGLGFGEKVMIYLDGPSYTRLFGAMVKALFPGISYELFKMFFVCAKATFDTGTVNLHDTLTDHSAAVQINREVVDRLYAFDDHISYALANVFERFPDEISLEWRIIKLRAFGIVGNIPETILNLQRRTALNNSHDAMDDWGRIIMDPTRWELSGATVDGILDAGSCFEACVNFKAVNDPALRLPGVLHYEMPDEWLIELLEEIVVIMKACGDLPCAGRNQNLLDAFKSGEDLYDPAICIKRLRMIFDNGIDGFRLGHLDSVKYDENLIRYVLRTEASVWQALMEDSTW